MESLRIPQQYLILPNVVPLVIPGGVAPTEIWTLAPQDSPAGDWFGDFRNRVEHAIQSRQFLPILRCSDGEYRFLLGDRPPSSRLLWRRYIVRYAKHWARSVKASYAGFNSQTAPGVSVGRYSAADWRRGRERFQSGMRFVLQRGILAAHLTFAAEPFAEHFYPAFRQWLEANNQQITADNYVPFYFVYGILDRLRLPGLVTGRRVLVVHGAQGGKRDRIAASLKRAGATSLLWHPISLDRAIFDKVSLTPPEKEADLAILGAGVGKFGLIESLADFPGPVVDAGYYFEAWAEPEASSRRIFVTVLDPDHAKPEV
jgi:hypothetical protein